MGRIVRFLREVRGELKKVVWPTRKEALRITWIVVVFSLTVAVFLGMIDFGLSKVIELIAS